MELSYKWARQRYCEISGSKSEGLEELWNSLFACVTIFVLAVNGKGFKVIYIFVLGCCVSGRREL